MEDNSLLKSRFLSLYCMVMADGIVEARELEVLYRIGRENYGISPEEINKMVMTAGSSFVAPTRIEDRISILYEMAEIAWADGIIEESEVVLLARYAVRFGFKEENSRKIAEFMIQQVNDGVKLQDVIQKILSK
ncbi:MAG: TerB family tellurite resistance protein [Bacteroidales bacterium]|nr:TerB family tellurite resistance protein [Bacteroidales bacterium]